MQTNLLDNELMAAIDIGSNSFHLAIARLDHGEVRKIASLSEKVQLAKGLDENDILSLEAQQRGLDCLNRFVGRLDSVPTKNLRIVATNALRKAKNSDEFIEKANQILPKPIEIIAGREEARLIYLGVSHTNASSDKRLVIDIGGGSTEYIIGQGFEPILTESLQMGCVSFTKDFFADGKITETAYNKAMETASRKLLEINRNYQRVGWTSVVGSSGTIKAVQRVLVAQGWADEQEHITYLGVKNLEKLLLKLGHVDNIQLEGVKEHRRAVFPAGVAILQSIMKELKIDSLVYSDGALREGVMYDMLGRSANEDVRDRSVQAFIQRYSVDKNQAERVVQTSQLLFNQSRNLLKLQNEDADLLRRASYLHEIGLAIGHSDYHKHSAYLLRCADIPGFSQIEQAKLSQLVLTHRRKLKNELLAELQKIGGNQLKYLCLLLRLSVVIHHGRYDNNIHAELQIINKKHWRVQVTGDDEKINLLLSDLRDEIAQFNKWGVTLSVE